MEPTEKGKEVGKPRTAVVAYGTKYGTTAKVAEEIASALRAKGIETTVADFRNTRVEANGYDLVVVGSSIMIGKWSKGAIEFLERSKDELSKKKVALFVCCGDVTTGTESPEYYHKKYLDDIAEKYGIVSPYEKGLFGGTVDFNSYNPLVRAIVKKIWKDKRKDYEAKGYDFSKFCDFRDWNSIKTWAASLGAN